MKADIEQNAYRLESLHKSGCVDEIGWGQAGEGLALLREAVLGAG